MQLPDFLQPFKTKANAFIADDRVKHIEFSGGTYQVQVIDPKTKEELWAFIQLDPRGQIKDCFCSCESSEDGSACVHIACAYLKIFGEYSSPLHQRFERSIWNKLFRLFSDRMGQDPDILKETSKGYFSCKSVGGKDVFYIKGKTQKAVSELREIIKHRKVETEETSLKFSNLPQEELTLWREGRPSSQLAYELSFWSDLAKWILLLQEEDKKYAIGFKYSEKHIPNYLMASFSELETSFYISEANLPLIIPSLSQIKSPLVVHNAPQETIKKLTYDKQAGCLLIESKTQQPKKQKLDKKGIMLNGWIFVPNDGFYIKDQHSLLSAPVLSGKQISQALNEYYEVIKALLEGTKLHEDPVQVSYAIAFDADWNLHIAAYLFNLGDLSSPFSRWFGDWVYLDEDGFYKIEGLRFEGVETIVPMQEVPEFIRQHRNWLNMHEGFQTHLASVEAQMTYHLSQDNYLTFGRKVAIVDEGSKTREFGPWVYISGQGFYAKVTSQIGLPLRPGIALKGEQIPFFIRMNREELQLVPGFFSEKNPVVKMGLNIELNENEQVVVSPAYELNEEYKSKNIRFLDDFVYVDGEGFHELPPEQRLPERFKHTVFIEKESLALFLIYELASLRRYAFKIDPRLVKPESIHLVVSHIEREPEKTGIYLLKLKYETERGDVPVTALWQALKDKHRFLFHESGLFDLDEKRYNWLKLLSKKQIDKRSHTVELSTLELIRLNAFEQIGFQKGKGPDYVQSKQLLEELTQFRIPEEPDLTGLKSQLRSYQILGIHWLWFLYEHNLSGLLCDDMGLGKTHQAMALMAAIYNQCKKIEVKTSKHFLVVCPTSVIYHWQEKLEAFLPGLRVCTFHGSQRSLEDFHHQYDVLLTSYGIWRIENELLSKTNFELAIFDEIQIAKNHTSRIYASLLNVQARMSLGLTGTPIENHLRELKALFDIVLPSYMPGETDYRELFIKPIEKEGNVERRAVLTRVIKPFVLRRRKGDVLLDLPDKMEEISHCELLPAQAQLYNEVLAKSRQRILDELREDKGPIPYMHIFAVLSSLKQICNHPAVYNKTPSKYKEFQSGKWDLFLELLSEARESQQKVVVFSQYLNMLDIIEDHLKETGIGFATIRGATIDRAEPLQRFNRDPDCEVFVASLQAAGLGVDLTAGSVVIHYDRWWNAARENQATDRVHRIGQTRGVQVFKLVTKGTLEEHIDMLIEKKGKLMEETIGVDDHQVIKQFTREEIVELLQYVEGPEIALPPKQSAS